MPAPRRWCGAYGAGVGKPPREETAGWGTWMARLGYGDLSAADEVCDWGRAD
jgi:hypothetical protein